MGRPVRLPSRRPGGAAVVNWLGIVVGAGVVVAGAGVALAAPLSYEDARDALHTVSDLQKSGESGVSKSEHEARAAESLEAAGATKVYVAPRARNTGWHLLGTTRMGDAPATSVVDGDGRCHDVPNLYVFGGSTWPTASAMNPTATIAALALRNTERLIAARRSTEVPAC